MLNIVLRFYKPLKIYNQHFGMCITIPFYQKQTSDFYLLAATIEPIRNHTGIFC